MIVYYKLNPDGSDELLYVSKRVEDLFEVSREEALNNNKMLWDRIHRDDLEEYLSDRSNVMFSHGICPECIKNSIPIWWKIHLS